MEETPRHLGAALINDLADKLTVMAIDILGVPSGKANDFGKEVALLMAADWGGQVLYIPMDLAGRLRSRNELLYKDFNGGNASSLALKYKLSVQQVYRIIKAERAERAQKQHSLFA